MSVIRIATGRRSVMANIERLRTADCRSPPSGGAEPPVEASRGRQSAVRSPQSLFSSRRRHLNPPGYDLLPQLLELRPHAVRDQGAVVRVVDVADALLFEAELVDATAERVVPHAADRVIDRGVDALDHRRQ